MSEDKRICPNCGHQLHRRPYLMSTDNDPIMSITQAIWVLCGVLAAVLVLAAVVS